eukprot:CAMPEP_0185164264 /NCGR_PEP_ID=MMETSP1139-20130426/9117_1 /TAXON_ID=298111 /ORGANISM="Pavlova sp., Strain CCMP459" /LENGTH=68 /DNA_ID=CAMNT_0027729637 /DNA_START=131 /DNA_END=334 /DNA_ORIENTATION=-
MPNSQRHLPHIGRGGKGLAAHLAATGVRHTHAAAPLPWRRPNASGGLRGLWQATFVLAQPFPASTPDA